MQKSNTKKVSIHATVSPYIKRNAEKLVETNNFSSMSDLVSTALIQFMNTLQPNNEKNDNTKSSRDKIKNSENIQNNLTKPRQLKKNGYNKTEEEKFIVSEKDIKEIVDNASEDKLKSIFYKIGKEG